MVCFPYLRISCLDIFKYSIYWKGLRNCRDITLVGLPGPRIDQYPLERVGSCTLPMLGQVLQLEGVFKWQGDLDAFEFTDLHFPALTGLALRVGH